MWNSVGFGAGVGPLNHTHRLEDMASKLDFLLGVSWFGGKTEAAPETGVWILALLLADYDLGQSPVFLEPIFLAVNGCNLRFLHGVVWGHLSK